MPKECAASANLSNLNNGTVCTINYPIYKHKMLVGDDRRLKSVM